MSPICPKCFASWCWLSPSKICCRYRWESKNLIFGERANLTSGVVVYSDLLLIAWSEWYFAKSLASFSLEQLTSKPHLERLLNIKNAILFSRLNSKIIQIFDAVSLSMKKNQLVSNMFYFTNFRGSSIIMNWTLKTSQTLKTLCRYKSLPCRPFLTFHWAH